MITETSAWSLSVEMNKLLQAKIDLEKELEMAREGEKERREQEQALR